MAAVKHFDHYAMGTLPSVVHVLVVMSVALITTKGSENLMEIVYVSMFVHFLCLMAYQFSWGYSMPSYPCRRTAVILFNP